MSFDGVSAFAALRFIHYMAQVNSSLKEIFHERPQNVLVCSSLRVIAIASSTLKQQSKCWQREMKKNFKRIKNYL
jgi:hypothetical protein